LITPKNFKKGDFVTLRTRGDVWRVEMVSPFGGYSGTDDMLTLAWVAGASDPGREMRFGSSTAFKLTEMEVIALSAQ
jgi:hypothetical protein